MAPAAKKQRLSDGGVVAVEEQSDAKVAAPVSTLSASDQQAEKDAAQKRSLFVRSLPASTTSESLTDLFSDAYPVKHAVAVADPATKLCRGYGFVTFADAEDAARAKVQFNGHVLDGKKLRVEIAEQRQRKGEEGEGPVRKKGEEREPQQAPKLIVRNLPWSIKGSEQLTKLFQSYGKINKAYVPKKGPGLMAGFGFVIFRSRKLAEKAIEGVNGKEVDGRTLAVDWAVEKDEYQKQVRQEAGEESEAGEKDNSEDEDEDEILDDDDLKESDTETEPSGSEEGDSDIEDVEGGIDVDDEDEDEDEDEDDGPHRPDDRSCTLFVRNLPFTCTDEDLEDHFQQFGTTRYARVVMEYTTGRSKGTGFVCFYDREDADKCVRSAPLPPAAAAHEKGKDGKPVQAPHSILQNDQADPTGQYTLNGRVLQVTRAVEKSEANRLTEDGQTHRYKRDNDKRKLYLLSEGTISSKSQLWEQLPPSEQSMRDASAKQRKQLIESNPSLHLSLTRLSVRNIPRSVGSKELKELARKAVVGFATDVKAGKREKLSREELARGDEAMQVAEVSRKKAGKGIVRQAKVVFESTGGSKVAEESGRSRGYGFVEYYTHRNALMGLRWLNGHAIDYQVLEKEGKGKPSREDMQDRKKRLIVEFAIENAQVVKRRHELEAKARARSLSVKQGMPSENGAGEGKQSSRANARGEKPGSRKRKRGPDAGLPDKSKTTAGRSDKTSKDESSKKPVDEKLAKLQQRNQIIGRKRAMRARRKGGKP